MIVRAIKTPVFKEGQSIAEFVLKHVKKPKEGSVIVVTSKIVALSESRTVPLVQKDAVIKAESEFALKTKYAWLTIKDGTVMANAGVDESNASGKLILLPKDSFKAAAEIRKALQKKWKLKKLGVLITDSRLMPLRAGVVGVALGYAGFKGIRDYRGRPDIFGRKLKMSQTDVADSLATAAVLEMGEGREQRPLAVMSDASVEFINKTNTKELLIPLKEDLYYPLFTNLR
jgi:coenzyme F420-0:L-glutamate ligase